MLLYIATDFNLGVYQTTYNGGAVVSESLFADALDLQTARVTPALVRFQNSNITTIEQYLWQVLGLSADPQREYDICMTGSTVGTDAGTITLRIIYTV